MKTIRIKILALTLTIIFGLGQVMGGIIIPVDSSKKATNPEMNMELNMSAMMVVFAMEDENYIDDIPFETKEIVMEMKSSDLNMPLCYTAFILEDEAYIDDIPFDTEEIAAAAFENGSNRLFVMDDESYIDDIPFDTQVIYECYHNNSEKHCDLVAK